MNAVRSLADGCRSLEFLIALGAGNCLRPGYDLSSFSWQTLGVEILRSGLKFSVHSADEIISEELFMEPFTALLLSTDPGPLSTTEKILEEYGVCIRVAGSVTAASQLVKSVRFDL